MSAIATDAEVFAYTQPGAEVPDDVVRVRVDPSVTFLPAQAFFGRKSWSRWSCVKASWK